MSHAGEQLVDQDRSTGQPVVIMVAPNGARLTTRDHPALPVTVAATLDCVCECVDAGASAVHLHVRDSRQVHVLDADLYRQATTQLKRVLGQDFPVQITTEAVGRYSQAQQIDVVKAVQPEFVSVALAEMAPDEASLDKAAGFYAWCQSAGVAVQHILYSPEEAVRFTSLCRRGVIPDQHLSLLFVLGRYTEGQQSDPATIDLFLQGTEAIPTGFDWMICAFGQRETGCLVHAAGGGGHVRVGFENNRLEENGTVAESNQVRVASVRQRLAAQQQQPAGRSLTRRVLGGVP